MSFLVANKVVVVSALLAISEVLAAIPAIKSNSIFELVVGFFKMIVGK